jgi:hypothetical protein
MRGSEPRDYEDLGGEPVNISTIPDGAGTIDQLAGRQDGEAAHK